MELVFNANQWRKHTKLCGILSLTMVGLSGHDLEKALNVAYEDFLKEFDSFGCVKDLSVKRFQPTPVTSNGDH
jgi:hypothetical protein